MLQSRVEVNTSSSTTMSRKASEYYQPRSRKAPEYYQLALMWGDPVSERREFSECLGEHVRIRPAARKLQISFLDMDSDTMCVCGTSMAGEELMRLHLPVLSSTLTDLMAEIAKGLKGSELGRKVAGPVAPNRLPFLRLSCDFGLLGSRLEIISSCSVSADTFELVFPNASSSATLPESTLLRNLM